jgi:hypothetical protein
MSFGSMTKELLGIPGTSLGLVKGKINEAFQAIQDENVWSWQLIEGGWLTPGLLGGSNQNFLSPGKISVSPYTNTITGDAVATAAWTNYPAPPLLTQQQIRTPYYSLYSIIALGNNGTVAYATVLTPGSGQTPGVYTVPVLDLGSGSAATISVTVNADGTVTIPPTVLTAGSGYTGPSINFSQGGTPATFSITLFATLTIDRPWMEPQQINANYMIYQCYFAAPPGFKKWLDLRDTTNNNAMDWWRKTQADLAEEDAERQIFDQPLYVVPYKQDTRMGSSTIGQMLYELWPHPISCLPYSFSCMANWPALVNPSDTVPYPLTDEIVKLRATEMLSLWKEMQKGDEMERGSGTDWKFAMQAARAEYDNRLKKIRLRDRDLVELFFTKMRRSPVNDGQPYGEMGNRANVGW